MSETDVQKSTTTSQTQSGISDVDLKHHSQELGVLGAIFGSRANAPVYIAALAIVFSFVLIGCIMVFAEDSATFSKSQMVGLIIPIITGALGFLFGKGTG